MNINLKTNAIDIALRAAIEHIPEGQLRSKHIRNAVSRRTIKKRRRLHRSPSFAICSPQY